MFAYCRNNPVNHSDPSGMCGLCVAGKNSDQFMTDTFCGGGGGTGTGNIGVSVPVVVSFASSVSLIDTVYFYVRTAVINQRNMDKTVEEILKTKQGRIRQAPLPPGGPDWKDILQKTLREIKELAQKNVKGYKEIYKLLTDGRFNR